MRLEGDHLFKVSQEKLWEALLDPDVLARTMPGCESLERTDDNCFKGAMNVAIGPVKGKFQGTLKLSELDPPNGYHLEMKGQGPSGFMKGEGDITLAPAEAGTLLGYAVDAQVGGRMAAVGQRLMESSGKVVAQQGLEGLAAQVETAPVGDEEAVETPTPVAATAPSQTAMAAKFAGGLWREMVPAPVRKLLGILFWLVLGAAIGWWARGGP